MDKQAHRYSSSDALSVREIFSSRKKDGREKSWSKSRAKDRKKVSKDECAYCKQKGYWKQEPSNIKEKESKFDPQRGKRYMRGVDNVIFSKNP